MQIFVARSPKPLVAELEAEYLAWMPPPVRASIRRYKRWQDRQATLFGKLLLLHFLRSEYPDRWHPQFQTLDRSPSGKPFLPGGPEFNISHSGEIVVLAVTSSARIGIDIERLRSVKIEEFYRYLPELSWLGERCDPEAIELFFDCWTQKEAVLKALGQGLSLAPAEVVLARGRARVAGNDWYLRKQFIAQQYCCHVASDRPLAEVTPQFLDLMCSRAAQVSP